MLEVLFPYSKETFLCMSNLSKMRKWKKEQENHMYQKMLLLFSIILAFLQGCSIQDSVDSHCCGSVAKSRPALCDPTACRTPGSLVLHHLLEFAQVHVHWVGDALYLSCATFSVCLQTFPTSVFSNEATVRVREPEYWNFRRIEKWNRMEHP